MDKELHELAKSPKSERINQYKSHIYVLESHKILFKTRWSRL